LIVSIASMKGGVGKSTITALFARQIVDRHLASVLVIDMDPQRGSTILLLGPNAGSRIKPPTICDILTNTLEGYPPSPAFHQAIRRSPYHEEIYVLPATGELVGLTHAGTPMSLLKKTLSAYPLSSDLVVLLDTGSSPTLCAMCLAAADLAFIPVTLSQQTAIPTINTLKVGCHFKTHIGALIPIMVGKAGWQQEKMEAWQEKLQRADTLKTMGVGVLTPMPFSQTIVRGKWRWGKIPQRFHPTLDEMIEMVLSHPAWKERKGLRVEPWGSMFVKADERIIS
jgi:MinD-like ATPase involved in chromosome partitioning or flagellar assembly